MDWPHPPTAFEIDAALRLAAAVACGVVIGLTRNFKNKPAGMRTQALVALGAALVSLAAI